MIDVTPKEKPKCSPSKLDILTQLMNHENQELIAVAHKDGSIQILSDPALQPLNVVMPILVTAIRTLWSNAEGVEKTAEAYGNFTAHIIQMLMEPVTFPDGTTITREDLLNDSQSRLERVKAKQQANTPNGAKKPRKRKPRSNKHNQKDKV